MQFQPFAGPGSNAAALFNFRTGPTNLSPDGRTLLLDGAVYRPGLGLEFTAAFQQARFDATATAQLGRRLDGIEAMTVGGWFLARRVGEQAFFFRSLPTYLPFEGRRYTPAPDFVNFFVGTDQRGFFLATINGYGPHTTLHEVRINHWHQLAVVRHADGYQSFFVNGNLIHHDGDSCWPEQERLYFRDRGDPAAPAPAFSMAQGGVIGEAWVYPHELSPDEIRRDYLAKRDRYVPAPAGEEVLLREVNLHPSAGLWPSRLTAASWPSERERIRVAFEALLGPAPREKVPLDPQVHGEEDCGAYRRLKVSFAVQPDDRMPAYLLVPKGLNRPVPAVICMYGSTQGAGKLTTVGLSGPVPGSRLWKNRATALDVVGAGFVALAPDYLRDGERVYPGRAPYDSDPFYERFPDWSVVGKDSWDTGRAVEYLQGLDIVDPERIGMIGHSYGGHGTIFAAALNSQIRAAVANGAVSEFRDHGEHWGRPPSAAGGQYIRALRPYVLDPALTLPVQFYEVTAMIAPRALLVGQAAGEHRPREEENYAAVKQVYEALGSAERVRYHWYAGEHDFPPAARAAAMAWFHQWLA